MTTIVYEIRGANGYFWSAYLYESMAATVAARCNADAALAQYAPFEVTKLENRS